MMRRLFELGLISTFMLVISSFAPQQEIVENDTIVYRPILVADTCYSENYIGDQEIFMSEPFGSPVDFKDLKRDLTNSSGFGRRFHPILKQWRFHRGLDFSAEQGSDIHSTLDGEVIFSGVKGGYGNCIIVEAKNYQVVFAHCHELFFEKGDWVRRGDVIGTVGSTGLSTAPHLHYEVKVNGRNVDPLTTIFSDT